MSSIAGNQMIPAASVTNALSTGAPSATAGPVGGGMEIGDVMRVLKQRKLTIIITTIVAYLLVAGGTAVTYLYFPGYRAEAIVELLPPPEDVYAAITPLVDPKRLELQLQGEARKLKSLWLLQEVLALPEVKATAYYRSYRGDFKECLYDLYADVSAGAVRNTALIRVVFSTRVPAEAELIVNSILTQYVNRTASADRDLVSSKLLRLQATQASMQDQLTEKRREIAAFRRRADVGVLETQRDVSAERLARLAEQITLLDTEAVDYETQLRAIENIPSYELPVTPEMMLQVDADPVVRFRREQVETLEIEVEALLSAGMFGPKHRQIELLKARRQQYQQMLAARREELYDQLRENQVETLQQNLQRVRNMQARLYEEVSVVEAQQSDLDRNLQEFEAMVSDRDRLEEQLAMLESQIAASEYTKRDEESLQRLKIRQRAEVAPKPTFPNLYLFLGGGFVLSFGLGLGLAFLREFGDQSVRTPVDIARYGRLSVLGSIPKLDDEEADLEEIETATRTAPHSLIAESFRQVRTNLVFSGPPESQQTLLITSPAAGCGKSTVALNLAVVLAQNGQRVLLIDCNFRRPFVREALASQQATGLSNALIGQAQFEDVVKTTEIPNLQVITSGPLPPSPAELLSTPAMQSLLERAARDFDRVILDGPPLLLMSDALVLAAQVSGVIVVSRAAANRKGQLRRAAEQLQRVGAHVIGAVLNGVAARAGGYFRRQYRDFYDYVSDETVPPELPGGSAAELEGKTASKDDDDVWPGEDDEGDDKQG